MPFVIETEGMHWRVQMNRKYAFARRENCSKRKMGTKFHQVYLDLQAITLRAEERRAAFRHSLGGLPRGGFAARQDASATSSESE